MNKVLMSGNFVIGEAAIRAGCRFYAGYPITPQNELTEYMAEHIRNAEGGVFIQSESEIAAINMIAGASAAGLRVMTSSSSPGISLKQEGISSMAACELPGIIVNIMRGGPGLGNIRPSQGDYFQATRGGGHGDYRTIVLAPASGQELADLTMDAFDLADKYRTPAMILADGMMGQMMEPVIFKKPKPRQYSEKFMLRGAGNGKSKFIRGLLLDPIDSEEHNWKLFRKYEIISKKEPRFEEHRIDDADAVIVAYGTAARIAKGAIKRLRETNLKLGLFRPITLWPFPEMKLRSLSAKVKKFIVFEMSTGQMLEDVRLALQGYADIEFHGRPGGAVPTPAELANVISKICDKKD
ncbi:MAG TPA: 3-methyl-2-oxobutanoate dehydrogenase subunit VorB [Smithella sp.]|nr:3-methyl-2-oxobutanoate dehydrogenase subunit VorB [Smithella sp.]HNY50044.1 3-methyl-2-oxobutanoate dehydrogenase subunit VorB [Smithella sp.]HOG89801.1 3-methyl-2-oxobutanoate dehydrogenase subunit VorB [Smithella sp.]HOU50042.1 3-methyl-2-oxobutanoate dehydrogenase subunit VorB [Smithella sp.]HQG65326.1 3-methyl-2-oxobutanoate dehydrogenase subunit VorB [Smithella sp.]